MKSLAFILAFLFCACAPCQAQGPQLVHLHETITLIVFGDTTIRTAGQTNVPLVVSAPNTYTLLAGTRSKVIMISSDFTGTIDGCPFTGNGTSFQDAFNAPPIPPNCDGDASTIVITAGSVRVQDLR